MMRDLFTAAVTAVTDRKGVTAAEYAILAVAIVAAVGTAVAAFGGKLLTKFEGIV
jgi:Flp pilus assembly pilin Flp